MRRSSLGCAGERDKNQFFKKFKFLSLCYVNSSFWKSCLVLRYQTNTLEPSDVLVMSGIQIYPWTKVTEPNSLPPAQHVAPAQQKVRLRVLVAQDTI